MIIIVEAMEVWKFKEITDHMNRILVVGRSVMMKKVMMTGIFDMKPTADSLMIKEKNRLSRKKAKGQAVEDEQGDG